MEIVKVRHGDRCSSNFLAAKAALEVEAHETKLLLETSENRILMFVRINIH